MFFWDSSYLIILPALIISIWAQIKVKTTFNKYSKFNTRNGKPAFEIVQKILSAYSLNNVKIERVEGTLTDHYDPRTKTLRLSDAVYNSSSISAIGVAAHEAGHAIQHGMNYSAITLRNSIAPVANITSWAAFPLFLIGFLMHSPTMITLGIIFFTAVVIFQLVTLPVEFDASARALKILRNGYFSPEEYEGAKKVLNAAAMTYVAAALTGILELVRLLLLSNSSSSND
jgi:hypothetical protein